MRFILTMLGIIIGVGSVIAVVAIGQGGEAVLKTQFTGPANTVELFYMPSDEEIEANPNILYEAAFTQEDISAIETIPEIEKVVATSTESAKIRYRQNDTDGMIMGINQAYIDVIMRRKDAGTKLIAANHR